jgi:hypothetical protein
VTDKVSSLVGWIGDLSNENRAILGGIALFVATLAGLATVFGAVGIIAGGIITILPGLAAGFGVVAGAVGLLTWPIVAAAAALGTIGYLLYTLYDEWDFISTWWGEVFDALADGVMSGIAVMKNLFLDFTPLGLIIKHWEPITQFFASIIDGLSSMFSGFFDWVFGKFEAVGNIVSSVANFFGLGGEDKSKDMSPDLKKVPQAAFGTTAGEYATQYSAANANPVLAAKEPLQTKGSPQKAGNTTNSIKIEVNNPSSDVDVERAVQKALNSQAQSKRNRSYEDQEI